MTFLRNRLIYYYPKHEEMLRQMYAMARELGGTLPRPSLLPHYEMLAKLLGWSLAKRMQDIVPGMKQKLLRSLDKQVYDRSRKYSKAPASR